MVHVFVKNKIKNEKKVFFKSSPERDIDGLPSVTGAEDQPATKIVPLMVHRPTL